MAPTKSLSDLQQALTQPGCPVCRLKVEAADRFLDSLLWESVNDPDRRGELRRTGGFCREHTWRLSRPGASLGVAIIARDLLDNMLRAMGSMALRDTPRWSLRGMHERVDSGQASSITADLVAQLTPDASCSACDWTDKMEIVYLSTLLDNLPGADGLLPVYETSDGLCAVHFRRALARVREGSVARVLVNAQRLIWERLSAHLAESIRKSDYRFRDELHGDEAGSWLRAIAALAGTRLQPEKP